MRVCRIVAAVYLAFAIGAFLLGIAGNFGWFGATADPLSFLPLMLLGVPTTFLLSPLDSVGAPIWLGQVLVIAAPFLQAGILIWVCAVARRNLR